jgi:hypothetical protein
VNRPHDPQTVCAGDLRTSLSLGELYLVIYANETSMTFFFIDDLGYVFERSTSRHAPSLSRGDPLISRADDHNV